MSGLVVGILLILFSCISMVKDFSENEWRFPLLELNGELKEIWKETLPGVKRRSLILVVLSLATFSLGSALVLNSSILQNNKLIAMIILGVILIWLLKGSYELIQALFSKKAMLLNYLFSPYLFVWRHDSLSEYSDREIASAICKVCNIEDAFIKNDMNLKEFLITLHKKTRPPREHSAYFEILEENIEQAKQMARR